MFRFAAPYALLLLGLLPLMVYLRSRRPAAVLAHSGLATVAGLKPTLALRLRRAMPCLLYTSDAADERGCV